MNCTQIVRQYDILKNDWGVFMPKGQVISGDFKKAVVEDLRENGLSYREAAKKYAIPSHERIRQWERIYLEEGPEGLYVDRRGRASKLSGSQKGRKPTFNRQVEEDLIAENQRLRAELDYLKNLNALVLKRVQQEKKRR